MNPFRKKISAGGEKSAPDGPRRGLCDLSELQEILGRWSPPALIGKLTPEVIHDINNLLTGILGYAELLTMKSKEDEGLKKGLDTIAFSAEKCKVLLGRILSLSRPSGMTGFGNVNEWLGEAIDLRHCALRHQQIEVIKDFTDPLPVISADGVSLQKAVLNLIFMTEKVLACREDNRTLFLKTDFEPQNQKISIRVAANGSDKDFPRLTEVLQSGYDAAISEIETYFGILEAKQWVELMGGTLTLETKDEHGPVFEIGLPVRGRS